MSVPTVYLAGPISGVSYAGADDWRQAAARDLNPAIKTFSPLRGLHHLRGEHAIALAYEHPLSTPKAIALRSRYDATHRDALLVNLLGAQRVSIGTMLELGMAVALNKPIVLIMDEGNVHDHPMVRHYAAFVETRLADATVRMGDILLSDD